MLNNNIVRLSHVLDIDVPSYGDRDRFNSRKNTAIANGSSANSSCWEFTTNHLGTHIDVPYHFNENGYTIDAYDNQQWFFQNVELVNITCNDAIMIDERSFEEITLKEDIELLLIRTNYEKYRGSSKYWNDNPGLSSSLADFFRTRYPKLRCVGFDFISLTSWKHRTEGKKAHKSFLAPADGNPILVIEDMSLSVVTSCISNVLVAPLIVKGADGAPVTIFANVH